MNHETVKSKIIRSLIEKKTLTLPQLVEITGENSNSIRGIVVSLLNKGVIGKNKKKGKQTEYFIRELEMLDKTTVEVVLNKMSGKKERTPHETVPTESELHYKSLQLPDLATMTIYKRKKELKENKKRIEENFEEIKNHFAEIEILTMRNSEIRKVGRGKIKQVLGNESTKL